VTDSEFAAYIGQSKWRRVAGHVRVVFEVEHTAWVTATPASAGAEAIASRHVGRWGS
jgi:hypothetical protein